MRRQRLIFRFTVVFLVACVIGTVALSAPTEKPLLWRIAGPVPSYLYGTIHVPDPRVLELPDVVRQAVDASDVLLTEIPLDAQTQQAAARIAMLPAGQNLRKLAGDELYGRLLRVISNSLSGKIPGPAVDLMAMSFAQFTPLAAVIQVSMLDYLPDMLAGRQPLDPTLYAMAVKAGKQVGGLETLEEQAAVFEVLTLEEQVKAMASFLDQMDRPRPGQVQSARQLVDLYLTGDLNKLTEELNRQDPEQEALRKKFMTRLLDDRNMKMADRIAARVAEKPAKSYFFAVGAGHYGGETGILAQLAKKGLKVTRVTADAGVRPAATR